MSVGKRLAATTQGTPYSLAFRMWRSRFFEPSSIAFRPSAPVASRLPPWCLSALAVATITTAFGPNPPARQTMSMNFSMPRSEPKPASVIR